MRQERIRARATGVSVSVSGRGLSSVTTAETDEERSLKLADKRTKVLNAYRSLLHLIDSPSSTATTSMASIPSASTLPSSLPGTRWVEIDCGNDTPTTIVHRILAAIKA